MKTMFLAALTLTLLLATGAAVAQPVYDVTVTNLTTSQIFSPPVIVGHRQNTSVFTPGQAASDELAAVAEDADATGLLDALAADPAVGDWVIGSDVIMPGTSATYQVVLQKPYNRLSVVGMLVTTNDAFYGLDSEVVSGRRGLSLHVPAWDAGSEANSEECAFIPGPPCGNGGVRDTDGAEGFVHVHRGMHGSGDLSAETYDWRNPAALITVTPH